MTNTIEPKLSQVIQKHLGVTVEQVTPDASLTKDLGVDSLDAVELLLAVNEEYGTRIQADALEQIETVQELQDLVQVELEKRAKK